MLDSLVKVTLPEMGESVTEGSIVEWRKKAGQWVDEGETIVDVTTDKVDVEVPSTVSGVITAIHGAEGETIPVGSVLVEIDTSAAKPAGEPAASAAPAPARPAGEPELVTPSSYGAAGSAAPPPEKRAAGGGALAHTVSHHARRLAERFGLDLAGVRGTGPDGLILREDVEAAMTAGTLKPAAANGASKSNGASAVAYPPVTAQAKVSEIKGSAATLASYMDQSTTIPTATSFRTLAVGTLELRRAELNAGLKTAGRSEKISFTHLIAYAVVQAAKEQPGMCAAFRREGGKPQRVEAGINLGLAVDSQRKDGSRTLVVPVIKGAATLDFVAFRTAYEDLVAKARDNKLSVEEQTGATFTLTNPGGIGTVASVPRLMVGQGTIVAAGAIAYPPGFAHAPDSTLKSLSIEKVMTMTSTYDHRIIQGAASGEFLKRIDELLNGAGDFYEHVFADFGLTAAVRGDAVNANANAGAQSFAPARPPSTSGELVGMPSEEMLRGIAAGSALVSAYRRHGHLAAHLDPLGTPPPGDPSLDPSTYHLTPAMMNAVPASVLRVKVPGNTLAEVLPNLRNVYSGTIAYEIEHISNVEQREWLREYIEGSMNRRELTPQRKVQILQRLTKVETMERYFRKQFMSQKTFSIEGLDVMIPMLEETISMLAEDGTQTAVLGMAHRGRLSAIAHVVNRPYEELLAEFEAGAMKTAEPDFDDADVTGDVKYHHGAEGTYVTPIGTKITVELANNPSHLEAVDGVVEGMTRCLQTDRSANIARFDAQIAAPILVHGDAAFAAQGIVAEVLNLQAIAGYATGGTIHIISNNQIGFTTDPMEGRSTRYASDLAKGYDLPIVHVNADDVETCIAAVHLAIDYRRKFGRDVLIDLIGYRRFGHNEQDEPAYTQPKMYDAIKSHPTVRELFAARLVAQGVLTAEQATAMQDAATARMTEAHRNVKEEQSAAKLITQKSKGGTHAEPIQTGIERAQLLKWSDAVVATPVGFTPSKKLTAQFAKRKSALQLEGEVDWGLGEALAFAALLSEGTPIRLTGQDTERGTFSHRHAVLHDANTNEKYAPLQHLEGAKASFEIHNSPLSEYACLGFEYGYSTEAPNALVLWEAQFGDFNNGAQIIIDQFISAGAAKWGETTRLTMLLPHGYEGAGPEHSSARLERFLSLSAEGNIRVANCSTAAQYFHLLRAQAKAPEAFPLVIMTPKSLLRNRAAYGTLDELVDGTFREVIDDPRYAGADRSTVERLLLCSGKVYYDMIASPLYGKATKTAIARVELLSPLPADAILELITTTYPNLKSVTWVQEEPKNMGARAHVRRRVVERLPEKFEDLLYVGRSYRASPSEGYPGAHAVEQERIIREALTEE
ncbi:MAG: multifunctional oxoglutarate decarboxylase/oxoglutarate dehydrogenase thiamine pyrophosphate-binding subunit/dihydrolipoyllysine-residue succinyltransferase subunit [Candidatus Lustribacter sp.]